MQNDDVIWQIINHSFCSFKSKVAKERTFCQNPYNVSGLCIRSACPLANSRYATIREEEGSCYLFVKTIERAHTPKNLWEKIKLPANYTKALELVSEQLEHFPKYLVHRNKQRLTKIHQMLIRMRKLKLKAAPKIVTTNTKVDRREIGKERKALKAAQLDRAIENELLERLKQVTDNEIYNYPERSFSKALNKASNKYHTEEGEEEVDPDEEVEYSDEDELEDGEDEELEMEEELEEEEEEGEEGAYNVEYIEDFEESDEEDEDEEDDIEDAGDKAKFSSFYSSKGKTASSSSSSAAANKKRKPEPMTSASKKLKQQLDEANFNKVRNAASSNRPRVEVEYELEDEDEEAPVIAVREKISSRGGGKKAASSMDYNF